MSRYIDADFVANGLREVLHKPINEFPDEFEQAINCLVYAISILKFAPTADVAPIIHAHWEKHFKRPGVYEDLYWHCTNCNSRTLEEYAPYWWLYCPHCGAKMDEEVPE